VKRQNPQTNQLITQYNKDIDIWMLRDNLKLSYEERVSEASKDPQLH